MKKEYIIGIDLGTTNCTMAFAKREPSSKISQFSIPQMTALGSQEISNYLPSFLYLPLEEELSKKLTAPSWAQDRVLSVGELAKARGSELPHRLIHSAKSWICHDGVNRKDKFLPLNNDEELPSLSPVDALSELLKHLKETWDLEHPAAPFADQEILITVPASFDPAARELVQESAALAGYPEAILLEEPQSAFYAWLNKEQEGWRKKLTLGDTVLVVDIGGGTSDFSLIEVQEELGNLILKRLAVGQHLLLGGDNMDLALAYLCKQKLENANKSVDQARFNQLLHQCRSAKERFMSDSSLDQLTLTLQGKGSKLIGGSVSVELSRKEVIDLIVDGFMPLVSKDDKSSPEKRASLQEFGLPFVRDPRVTCQLAKFLSESGTFIVPTHVLFNGGTLKGAPLQQRLIQQLNHWAKSLDKSDVKVLEDPDLDFAVSIGAVYYGLARNGQAVRIKAGTSRSYFIGVEGSAPAIPGLAPPLKALCVAPFGMEEGSSIELKDKEFVLLLGEKATFRFFSDNTNQHQIDIGACAPNWQQLHEMHPIESMMEKKSGDGSTICVKLQSTVTELGSLQLFCVAADGRKWKLEFDTR